MEIDKDFPTICLQDVDVTCSECGEVCRVFTMWERDESPGCSAESLFGYFETCGPELKRIIDSHDDVLKDKYLGEFLP